MLMRPVKGQAYSRCDRIGLQARLSTFAPSHMPRLQVNVDVPWLAAIGIPRNVIIAWGPVIRLDEILRPEVRAERAITLHVHSHKKVSKRNKGGVFRERNSMLIT